MFTELPKVKYKKNKYQKNQYMPQDTISQKILLDRAQKLAKPQITTTTQKAINYIRFRLGMNEYYGLTYAAAKEVLHYIPPTKIPFVPDYVSGIINRRGALVTIFDLKKFFNLPASDVTAQYIIIFESKGMTAGFLADQIEGNAAYDSEQLTSPLPINHAINPIYIQGLDQGVTAILNIEMIMTNITQQLETKK